MNFSSFQAAEKLRITASELCKLKIADGIIPVIFIHAICLKFLLPGGSGSFDRFEPNHCIYYKWYTNQRYLMRYSSFKFIFIELVISVLLVSTLE